MTSNGNEDNQPSSGLIIGNLGSFIVTIYGSCRVVNIEKICCYINKLTVDRIVSGAHQFMWTLPVKLNSVLQVLFDLQRPENFDNLGLVQELQSKNDINVVSESLKTALK